MLILDALVAGLIFKIFGEQGLIVLGMVCAITLIRTCMNVNEFLQIMVEETICEEEEN